MAYQEEREEERERERQKERERERERKRERKREIGEEREGKRGRERERGRESDLNTPWQGSLSFPFLTSHLEWNHTSSPPVRAVPQAWRHH